MIRNGRIAMNVRLPLVDWSSKTNRERARGGFLLHQRDWKNDVREEQVRIPFFACSPPFFSVISITEKMCLRHLLLCLLVGVIVIVNGESLIYPLCFLLLENVIRNVKMCILEIEWYMIGREVWKKRKNYRVKRKNLILGKSKFPSMKLSHA